MCKEELKLYGVVNESKYYINTLQNSNLRNIGQTIRFKRSLKKLSKKMISADYAAQMKTEVDKINTEFQCAISMLDNLNADLEKLIRKTKVIASKGV